MSSQMTAKILEPCMYVYIYKHHLQTKRKRNSLMKQEEAVALPNVRAKYNLKYFLL
jgi:hypothetical protein